MKIEVIDIISLMLGLGLGYLGYSANIDTAVFVGGAWVGAFLFKLGYVCEQRWRGEQ